MVPCQALSMIELLNVVAIVSRDDCGLEAVRPSVTLLSSIACTDNYGLAKLIICSMAMCTGDEALYNQRRVDQIR